MKHLSLLPLLAVAALLLAGCGTTKHVFPPDVSVQQLQTGGDGPWQVTLRLRNYSLDSTVHFDHVHADLTVGNQPATTIDADPDIDVAERSSDVVHVSVDASAPARAALRSDDGARQRVAYRLKGTVLVTGENGGQGSFPIDRQGWLSPVPGVPGTWR